MKVSDKKTIGPKNRVTVKSAKNSKKKAITDARQKSYDPDRKNNRKLKKKDEKDARKSGREAVKEARANKRLEKKNGKAKKKKKKLCGNEKFSICKKKHLINGHQKRGWTVENKLSYEITKKVK